MRNSRLDFPFNDLSILYNLYVRLSQHKMQCQDFSRFFLCVCKLIFLWEEFIKKRSMMKSRLLVCLIYIWPGAVCLMDGPCSPLISRLCISLPSSVINFLLTNWVTLIPNTQILFHSCCYQLTCTWELVHLMIKRGIHGCPQRYIDIMTLMFYVFYISSNSSYIWLLLLSL